MKYLLFILTRPFTAIATLMETSPILVINVILGAQFTAYLNGSINSAIQWMMLVLLFVVVDLAFGLRAAINRRERVTCSNAVRRTVSKSLGYFCWILGCCCWTATTGRQAYTEIGCGIAAGIEALSALGNYLEIHGYAISLKGFLKMLGNKFGLKGLENSITKDDRPQRGCGGIEYKEDDNLKNE